MLVVKNVIGLLVNTNMAVDTKLTKTIPYKKEKYTEHCKMMELALCMKDPKYYELLLYPTLCRVE